MNDSLSLYAPADNVLTLLAAHAPDELAVVSPFIPRLFNALADGHGFIYVNGDDAAALSSATSLVGQEYAPFVLYGQRLFLGRMFQLERDLAREIRRLSAPQHGVGESQRADLLAYFADVGSRDQQAAAALALVQNFTVISGGPGTGKTTTVAKLLALLCGERQPRIALAAPTGKAAARMSEALKQAVLRIDRLPETTAAFLTSLEGQTVHRLLGLKPPQMLPEYHAHHRLPLDILVIDEASMLDAYLLLQLLQALPSHCRLILLGDEHQLPSVNAGAVLAALVRSSFRLPETSVLRDILLPQQCDTLTPPVARLTISHRFGADSGIGCLARAVVSGDAETAWAQFDAFPNELAHHKATPEKQAATLYQQHTAYWQAIDADDKAAAFAHQTDVVALAARRADAALLNEQYKKILQQHGRATPETMWYAGQMLMITRNDPATRLFNGDIGIVMNYGDGLAAWFADTGNTFRAVPLSRLPAHETAFAMTVHKSQGSEYTEVWLLPPQTQEDATEQGFSRALLYTAITRAKQRFVYWGNQASFQAACQHQEKRRTALAEFLRSDTSETPSK